MSLVEKCRLAEEEITRDRGPFTLFGLFEREENPGRWDILFSAPWAKPGRETLEYVIGKMTPHLDKANWIEIAHLVPLAPTEDFVKEVTAAYRVEHGAVGFSRGPFNGIPISRAYIITSRSAMPEARPHLAAS